MSKRKFSFKRKRIFVIGGIILSFLAIGVVRNIIESNFQEVLAYEDVEECKDHNVGGYAWSENIGWISFSCKKTIGKGVDYDYGVDINEETGIFSGYAWSENIGWISFNEIHLEGCPEGECEAKINTETGKVTGWFNTGKWASLSGNTGEGGQYGVGLLGNEFQGWAWGGDIIGWISFNCENQGVCSQSDYNVYTDLTFTEPETTSGEVVFKEIKEDSYCGKSNPPVWLDWSYISEGASPQKIDIQITEEDHFEDEEQCGEECALNLKEINYIDGDFYVGDNLSFDSDYLVRIRVQDEDGNFTNWETKEFRTQIKYPKVDFSWSPSIFYQNERVFFEDNTNYYQWDDPLNRTTDINLTWEFPDSASEKTIEGTRSEAEEVFNEFKEKGSFEVSLQINAQIKDSESNTTEQSCQITKTVKVGRSLPYWRETY